MSSKQSILAIGCALVCAAGATALVLVVGDEPAPPPVVVMAPIPEAVPPTVEQSSPLAPAPTLIRDSDETPSSAGLSVSSTMGIDALRPGDRILSVDGQPVGNDVAGGKLLYQRLAQGSEVIVLVVRADGTREEVSLPAW